MKEECRQVIVDGIETNYIVSNYGKVISLKTNRALKPTKDRDGYLIVGLHYNGKSKTFKVHRLVAIAFLPNPDNLPQINHINEVKTDNRLINLEWCSAEYNVNYGTRTERALETKRSKRKNR